MDVEKTVEFLLEQQARISGNLEQVTEDVRSLSNSVTGLFRGLEQLTGIVERVVETQSHMQEEMLNIRRDVRAEMGDIRRGMAERSRATDERVDKLVSAIAEIVRRPPAES